MPPARVLEPGQLSGVVPPPLKGEGQSTSVPGQPPLGIGRVGVDTGLVFSGFGPTLLESDSLVSGGQSFYSGLVARGFSSY
jgi:hypothetical protein